MHTGLLFAFVPISLSTHASNENLNNCVVQRESEYLEIITFVVSSFPFSRLNSTEKNALQYKRPSECTSLRYKKKCICR